MSEAATDPTEGVQVGEERNPAPEVGMTDRSMASLGVPIELTRAKAMPSRTAWTLSATARAELEEIERATIRCMDDPRLRGLILR